MNKEQGFLILVLAVAVVVSLFIVLPFLQFILAAIILAYVLHPLNARLVPHLGPRRAPLVTIPIGMAVALIPLAYITWALVQDLLALSRGEVGLDTDAIEATIADLTGREVDLAVSMTALGNELLEVLIGDIGEAISLGLQVAIGLALALFLLYYLLRDGVRFIDWTIDVAPMSNAVCSRIYHRVDRTTWGVVYGHLLVALIQGLVGGVGLFIAGIPNVVFWTFAMIVLALLPLVGAFLVWGPAAAYLVAIGQTEWGVFLFLYGVFVVSLIDNFARPIVIDREAHLNPGVVLIGVFGGIYAIGLMGLFIGPIVLAVLVAMVEAFDEEFDTLDPAAG